MSQYFSYFIFVHSFIDQLSDYEESINDRFSPSIAERNCEVPTSQTEEDVSKDSRRDEQKAAWDAEDEREDLEESVTQQSEISEQEAVKIKSKENERMCGEGNRGLL